MNEAAQEWRRQAERATGLVEDMLALAGNIAKSPHADAEQKEAAKRVVNSARTVIHQPRPTDMQIEVLRRRYASLKNALAEARSGTQDKNGRSTGA